MDFNLETFLYCILCSLGTTMIVLRGSLFAPIREIAEAYSVKNKFIEFDFAKLLSCPMCFGFWSGAIFGTMFFALGFASPWIILPASLGTSLLAPLLDPVRWWS